MSFVITSLVCAQLVFPTTPTAIEFGDDQLQQYPASVGAIAWKADGGLAAIWLDGRRSLGEAAVGNRVDLWGSKLIVDNPAPVDRTGLLLATPPVLASIESPAIAFNSNVVAIVWIERRAATATVQLAIGDENDRSILAAPRVLARSGDLTGVTVGPAGSGFMVAWTEGTRIWWARLATTGQQENSGSTFAAGVQTVATPLVGGVVDGGAAFAYSSAPTPRAGFFTHDYVSPTSDAGSLFDVSGALAGISFHSGTPSLMLRISGGVLQSRPSLLSFTTVTSTRALSECVVAGSEALTALAYVDLVNATSQVGFITPAGTVNVIDAPPAEAVAVATNSTHGAYLRRANGLSVLTRMPASPTLEPPTELNFAQPTQRVPSVAWLPDAGGFVVAHEERGTTTMGSVQTWTGRLALVRLDGGTDDLGATGTPQVFPVFPRVVEWDENSVGVEEQDLANHTHRLLSTITGVPPPTTIGARGWHSAAGPPLLRWRESAPGETTIDQAVGTSIVAITEPRCVTTVNGRHLVGGWIGSTLRLYDVLGLAGNSTAIDVPANVVMKGSVCVTRGRDASEALATWSQGDLIRVLSIGRADAVRVVIPGPPGTRTFENPVATRLGSGVLVVWETPPAYSTIGAAFIDDSSPTVQVPVVLHTGADLVRHPTVTSAPGGPALVAWQEFDAAPGVGATRVRARLVFPRLAPDAAVDAGSPDAGLVDGGSLDGGGQVDAGDAIPVPTTLTFTPSCGCSGGPGALALVLLALWARRGSPRTR
ncbi:MAG: hypothetical protein Q8L14_01710 [Myxococcales bacterium]|nr:hypothetical protein [Myxococcales bacterium]